MFTICRDPISRPFRREFTEVYENMKWCFRKMIGKESDADHPTGQSLSFE